MGEVELGGHFDGRCSFSTPQKGSRVSGFTQIPEGARAQGAVGWGPPSVPAHQPADGEQDNTHLSLTRWLGWRLNSECLFEKLPQEKQSDGHLAFKFLSKCPDSGCEQGGHTVKRIGSNSERNGCVFRETEVGFSHQPTPPHLH